MELFLFLFTCFLKIIFSEKYYTVVDFNSLINTINQASYNTSFYIETIECVKDIMFEYPYINILKDPPLINNTNYFEPVDIIYELDNLKNEINSSSSVKFYNFYQNLFKIIKKTKDLMNSFDYEGEILELTNTFVFSPFSIKTINKEKKLYISTNFYIDYFQLSEYVNNYNIIESYEDKAVISINGEDPFNFIRNFCKDYFTTKNINAKFSFSKIILNNYFSLSECPMNLNDFTFKIKYENNEEYETNFVGIYIYEKEENNQNNKINSKIGNFINFMKYQKNKTKGKLLGDRKLIKKYLKLNLDNKNNQTYFRKLESDIKWDIETEDGEFKCRIDYKNKVNVYYQDSFLFDLDKNMYLLFYCQYNFLMNDYPIVFIEDDNSGGYLLLTMIFQEIIQNLYNNQMKCSIKFGNYTNKIVNEFGIYFNFLKETGDLYENAQDLLNDNITEKLSETNYNQRLKQRPFYLHYAQFYKDYIIKSKYKKPTEIIIFTDGFSCGATSLFIKSLYNFGGAIIVGYSGDPATEKNNFDASQSPTIILEQYHLNYSIPSYNKLINNGFNFSQIAYIPVYKNQYIEGQLDYPEEFQVTPVDERIDIYDDYYEYLYQDFIDKAKEIFKKYNEDNLCNPNNKNLKLLSKDCDKNFNKYTYGGYECGDDGKWNNTCKPFYCHKNYYFDYVNQKCVKDVIAEKYSIQNIESEEEVEEEVKEEEVKEEEVKEEEEKEEEENKNKKINDLN